jgi:hypothetical protein
MSYVLTHSSAAGDPGDLGIFGVIPGWAAARKFEAGGNFRLVLSVSLVN